MNNQFNIIWLFLYLFPNLHNCILCVLRNNNNIYVVFGSDNQNNQAKSEPESLADHWPVVRCHILKTTIKMLGEGRTNLMCVSYHSFPRTSSTPPPCKSCYLQQTWVLTSSGGWKLLIYSVLARTPCWHHANNRQTNQLNIQYCVYFIHICIFSQTEEFRDIWRKQCHQKRIQVKVERGLNAAQVLVYR